MFGAGDSPFLTLSSFGELSAEDEMVRQHHRLSGQKSEQTPGDSGGQGSLAWCSPWGRRETDKTPTERQHQLTYLLSGCILKIVL